MFLLSFSDLIMIMIYVIKNCDVLMKIIMMLRFTQSLRPNIYTIIKLCLIGYIAKLNTNQSYIATNTDTYIR